MSTPSWDDVEVGDKVVLEFESTVESFRKGRKEVYLGNEYTFDTIDPEVCLKSVEKPVREFKPGDVVRSVDQKVEPYSLYTIGEGRHYDHDNQEWVGWTLSPAFYELVD